LHLAYPCEAQSAFGSDHGADVLWIGVVMARRQVLIVDDNAQLRRLLNALLQSDGRFEVVGDAADGGEALRLVDELDPELMLLDLSMPGMDGLEVLGQLAGRDRAPITVVLSGYLDEALREQVLEAGATLCLEKGLDFTDLTDRLASAAARGVPYRSR